MGYRYTADAEQTRLNAFKATQHERAPARAVLTTPARKRPQRAPQRPAESARYVPHTGIERIL